MIDSFITKEDIYPALLQTVALAKIALPLFVLSIGFKIWRSITAKKSKTKQTITRRNLWLFPL